MRDKFKQKQRQNIYVIVLLEHKAHCKPFSTNFFGKKGTNRNETSQYRLEIYSLNITVGSAHCFFRP